MLQSQQIRILLLEKRSNRSISEQCYKEPRSRSSPPLWGHLAFKPVSKQHKHHYTQIYEKGERTELKMLPVLSKTNVLVSQEDRWEICDTLGGELGMDSESPIQ